MPNTSKTMRLTTRVATLQDIPQIIELAEKSWLPTYRDILVKEQLELMFRLIYSSSSLKKQFTEHTFILAFEGNEAKAFSSFTNNNKEIVKIQKLYILPDNQGKGIGSFIVDYIAAEAKNFGASTLELNVNRYNTAKVFYEKMGFKIHEVVDIPFGNYWLNDYVMRKEIY